MTLNGIDVSSFQTGINLAVVPADFVIVKVTQGTYYTNPDWRRQANQTLQTGKALGLYIYVAGGGAKNEVTRFVRLVKPFLGKAVLAVDWESGDNTVWGNYGYLSQIVAEIIRQTKVRPLIYASAGVYRSVLNVGNRFNCGLWIAQYGSIAATGYQSRPWNEGAYGCAIRQYASTGRLPGWGGNLDLDKFYGNRNDWLKYQGKTGKRFEVITEQDKKDIAAHVWNYMQNGVRTRDRLQGIDGAANNASRKANALARTLLRTDDAGTGNGVKTDMYTSVRWGGHFVKMNRADIQTIMSKIDSMEQEIQELKAALPQQKEANNG